MTLVAVTLFSGIEHGIFCFNYKTSYIHGTRTDGGGGILDGGGGHLERLHRDGNVNGFITNNSLVHLCSSVAPVDVSLPPPTHTQVHVCVGGRGAWVCVGVWV